MVKTIKNMMLAAVCLLLVQSVTAQAGFGIKAGINVSNPQVDVENSDIETSGVTNLQLGLLLDLPVSNSFSFQPEFNYVARGYESDDGLAFPSLPGLTVNRRNIGYVDLGALAKLKFGQNDGGLGFYLGAGPFFSYAVSGTEEYTGGGDDDIDWDNVDLKRSEISLTGALGLTFGSEFRWFLDGRYMAGLSDSSNDDDTEIRNNNFGLTIGLMIPL